MFFFYSRYKCISLLKESDDKSIILYFSIWIVLKQIMNTYLRLDIRVGDSPLNTYFLSFSKQILLFYDVFLFVHIKFLMFFGTQSFELVWAGREFKM